MLNNDVGTEESQKRDKRERVGRKRDIDQDAAVTLPPINTFLQVISTS